MDVKNLTPPRWFQRMLPQFTWYVPRAGSAVYLTFDDGPAPGVTDWVLDELGRRGAKATFFCVGHNAERYPDLLSRMVEEGHTIGNHTYSHLSDFSCTAAHYLRDVQLAEQLLRTKLFRPPYGRISVGELRALRSHGFAVVLWSRLSMDYSSRVSAWDVYRFSTEEVRGGDVLVFHDSYKAEMRLRYALPRCLDRLQAQGFTFAPLREHLLAPVGYSPIAERGRGVLGGVDARRVVRNEEWPG